MQHAHTQTTAVDRSFKVGGAKTTPFYVLTLTPFSLCNLPADAPTYYMYRYWCTERSRTTDGVTTQTHKPANNTTLYIYAYMYDIYTHNKT